MLKTVLTIVAFIGLVNGHGHLFSPESRNPENLKFENLVSQGCNINFHNTYFTNWDCSTVCGNRRGDSSSTTFFPDHTIKQENMRVNYDFPSAVPAKRTYKQGKWIQLVHQHTDHPGRIRVKLCQLNSSTQAVTQDCLDRNLLELRSADRKLQLDRYTLNKTLSPRPGGKTTYVNQTFEAKLPDGLFGENFVLQVTVWRIEDCYLSTDVKSASSVEDKWGEYCPQQTYLSCVDFRIERDPSLANVKHVNVPVVKRTPPAKLVSCIYWDYKHDNNVQIKLDPKGNVITNNTPDPLKNIGLGVKCIVPGTDNSTNFVCYKCRERCVFESKHKDLQCPKECLCRWYDEKSIKLF